MKSFKNFLTWFTTSNSGDVNTKNEEDIVLVVKTCDFKFQFTRAGRVVAHNRRYEKEGKTKLIYKQSTSFKLSDVRFENCNAEYADWEFLKTLSMFAFDRLQESADSHYRPVQLDKLNASTDSAECEALKNIRNRAINDCIKELTPAQQEVFFLRYYDGLTQSEIATRLGISRSSVQDRLRGAEINFKKHFSYC